MTSTPSAVAELRVGSPRPRNAWVLVGVGTAAVLLLVTWLVTFRPVLGSCVMPDGTRLVLSSITYGKVHHFDDRSPLMRAFDSVMRRPSRPEEEAHTERDAAVAWVRVAERRGRRWNGLYQARLVDSHGCDLGHPPVEPLNWTTTTNERSVFGLVIGHLPRDGGLLQLEIPIEAQSSVSLSFPAPRLPEGTTPIARPLPQKVVAEDVLVSLHGVGVDERFGEKGGDADLRINPIQGTEQHWSAGWFALTDGQGKRILDPSGWSSAADNARTWFQTPCWRDSAWKMEVGVAPAPGTAIRPEHEWFLPEILVPSPNSRWRGELAAGPAKLVIKSLSTNGFLIVPKGKNLRLTWMDVEVEGWNEGGRLVVDRVNGDSVVKRLQAGGVSKSSALEQYCALEVLPGKPGKGFFRFPLLEGEKSITVHFSGYRYRMAEFAFNPAEAGERR